MGSANSTVGTKIVSTNESEKSARNVLDVLAEDIKKQAENDASGYEKELKGKLEEASFSGAYGEWLHVDRYGSTDPCGLHHMKNTNLLNSVLKERDPCDGRNQKRFGENEGFECSKSKIKGNENKNDVGSCAPPRRRHICDKNLEAINVDNTTNSNDLLGNILVTAKYEGDYIVQHHPQKETSDICIALARSFADIGDIVRGTDMFLGNNKEKEKIEKSLQNIFQNIQQNNQKLKNLTDKQIREYWWALNRKDVWNALTCSAPYDANYYRKYSDKSMDFTSQGQCGHKETKGDLPTNLDYVPQFLRWLNEWAEEFCRIKNIKIENVKNTCIGEHSNKHCSGEGYNCELTDLKKNKIFMDLECPKCADECKSYETWVENKKKEFNKQKEKYEKEMDDTEKPDNNGNGIYNKKFYNKLKISYKKVNSFFELLNKGPICQNINKKIPTDYKDTHNTFSRAEHCKSCPILGAKCKNGQCNSFDDITCTYVKGFPNRITDKNNDAFVIDILLNDNKIKKLSHDLKDVFNECDLFKRIRKQNWNCKYKCNLDVCELKNINRDMDDERFISIEVLIKRWLEHFLKDNNKIKETLNECINNGTNALCIEGCYKNCVCVEKWIKEKRGEWENIKERYVKRYKVENDDISDNLKVFLKEGMFTKYIKNALNKGERIDTMKESAECIEHDKSNGKPCKKKDVITILLNRLEKQMDNCKMNHVQNGRKYCIDMPKSPNEDDEDEDKEQDDQAPSPPKPKPPSTPNPCVGKDQSGTHIVGVEDLAGRIQRETHDRVKDVVGLKADASQGQYKRGGNVEYFKGEKLCEINEKHSNADDNKSKNPCNGKGSPGDPRFEIGTPWREADGNGKKTDVLLPPRRRHMCTSNLEHLMTNVSGLSNSKFAGNSLLGDVLVAAKKEAEYIKGKYKKTPEDLTICRSMKYSFADIGDIIRGRDMWDLDDGSKKMETNLRAVFKKIHETISDKNDKYNGDNISYTTLREHWWSANRDEVWRAMKCSLPSDSKECSDIIPYDDYIPQRLRWMTEWVEWYCKEQSRLYGELVEKCQSCKDKHDKECTKKIGECKQCGPQCKQYTEFIKKWKPQWEKIKEKYEILYVKAKKGENVSNDDKDKHVVDFLTQLRKANGVSTSGSITSSKRDATGNSDVYSTASGYIHQELQNMECKKQNIFCNNTTSGKVTEYTFKELPPDYEKACGCEQNPKAPPKKPEVPQEDLCSKVKRVIGTNDGKKDVGRCNQKYNRGKLAYPKWDCKIGSMNSENHGACMPPRRQKLCIYDLEHNIKGRNRKEDLKEAFVLCAAKETFLLWQKYKEDKENKKQRTSQLDNLLKVGTIPPEFLRSMFYTFGDFRDLCLNKDISELNKHTKAVKENVDTIFNDRHKINDKERKEFWDSNANVIWDAMLCALTHASGGKKETLTTKYGYEKVTFDGTTKLEEFSNRPQFFRWLTEWGEDFCKKRGEKVKDLVTKCNVCSVSDNPGGGKICDKDSEGCQKCSIACTAYKDWLKDWKEHYDKQMVKFKTDKNDDPEAKDSTNAYEYLNKKLEKFCESGSTGEKCEYTCMGNASKQQEQSPDTIDMPASLDDEPQEVQGKCNCTPQPDACTIVDAILGNRSGRSYAEGCRQKYKMPLGGLEGWLCNNKGNKEDGDVCIPPRRRRLYIKDLQDLTEQKTPLDLREAFIKCAAIETFFSWHEFKKEKDREDKEKNEQNVGHKSSVEEELQNYLKTGEIHDDFKRRMFYTFGDYRDICLGNNLGKTADTTDISVTVTSILNSGTISSGKRNTTTGWWEKNGEDIWKGMLCALSYDSKTKEMDPQLRTKLTEEHMYNYGSVSINGGPSDGIPLSDFAKKPTYFRWLEEWGEEFCRKRTHKLENIENECRGLNGSRYCDDDGFDCIEMGPNDSKTIVTFKCPSCAKSCTSYKHWIDKKKKEFIKQKDKYENESKHYDEQFYTTLRTYPTITKFLGSLKDRSCSNNNNEYCKIDFTKPDNTFGHAKNCVPCPVFGVKYMNGKFNNVKEKNCHKKTFNTTDDIKTMEKAIDIDMLVIDNTVQGFPKDLQNVCKNSNIFTGIRKDEWTCGYFCDLDICKPKTFIGAIDDKENVPIRVLFKRWVENFLKDYNKIKENISQCINNEKRDICIDNCRKNCKCLEEWIKLKETEWENIKKRYQQQYEFHDTEMNFFVISFLEGLQPQTEVEKVKGNVNDLRDLEESIGCTDNVSSGNHECKKKDVVESLLNKLQKEIKSCKDKPNERTQTGCTPPSPISPDSETPPTDIPLVDVAPPFCNVPPNPCVDKDATNVVNVEEVAKEIQEQIHDKMMERSGKKFEGSKGKGSESDESVLKGNISQGKFKEGASPNEVNNVCQITEKHSNAHDSSKDPCNGNENGSDTRFQIETEWKDAGDKDKEIGIYLPPRRQHICTSNLEHLLNGNDGPIMRVGNDKINHSFLGEVLIAAKFEGDYILKNFNKKNKADPGICRAMRYSFADIGDIIRGKDLWDHGDQTQLQGHLQTIFGKIKEELKSKLNGKYEDDTDDKHLELRQYWWEANRKQIWDAMQCKTPSSSPYSGTTKCSDTPPYDDYIPQRLRWMMEWAELYCKYQSKEYDTLQKACKECRSGICETGYEKCTKCTEACKKYGENIKKWEDQWKKIKEIYEKLYEKAIKTAVNPASTLNDSNDEKDVVNFLKTLYNKNSANTIYSTAAGYIHQEAKYIDCNIQNEFCKKKNGSTSSDAEVNDKYAFRSQSYDYDDACACKIRYPEHQVLKDPCDIVKTLLSEQNEIGNIDHCKKNKDAQWKCGRTNLIDEEGVCMPPRTQNLCIHYLNVLNDGAKEEELREAFIKTAAAETYFSWKYYKSKNDSDANLLDKGIIPPQFLRLMFYTFADYRDICLDKDISAKTAEGDLAQAKNNIGKVFSKEGGTTANGLTREYWWKEYGLSIWQGMLCVLSYNTETKNMNQRLHKHLMDTIYKKNDIKNYLEEFSSRPPFLRWYIEWSDEFCREQKKEYKDLVQNCTGCNLQTCGNKCERCKDECKKYERFITQWKDQWTTQSSKYSELYQKAQKDTNDSTDNEKHVVKYLSQLPKGSGDNHIYSTSAGYLEKEGYISECMEQNNFSKVDSPKYAFHNYPNDHKTKCTCNPAPPPPRPLPKPKPPQKPPQPDLSPALKNAMLSNTIMWSVGISFAAISYFLLKKKSKSSVDLLRVLNIPKGEYEMPTLKSQNRYIPYRSGSYKGKTYIYMEGDTSGDEDKYIWDLSSSDITSSESEYEEMDINDIYPYTSPKYKTLIEVVLEPSKSNGNTLGDDMVPTTNTFTDEEWNELKHDFISQYLPNTEPNNNYRSGDIPMSTEPNTLYFDKPEEKPFITSIHDRDLYTGEEINYNINMVNNDIPISARNDSYSGIDLINDSLSGGEPIDIYDELLKRKENELFGTKHPKRTSNNSVAKNTNSDPIDNQLNLFHKWLDRHRDMCEQWNNKEDILKKLNEEWNKDNDGGNVPIDNKRLNTDVSIQIDMDHGKPKKEFTNMDTNMDTPTMDSILDDLETYNEPFYDIYEDDVYYDVNDDNKTSTDHNNLDVSSKVQIEMDVNSKLVKEKYPISDVWDI